MNRGHYFDYIEEKLNILAWRIAKRSKINLLELNIHSETFFADMLNILFGYQLENLNASKHNVEGIDLIDKHNKIIVQVSSTCTKQKIETSLANRTLAQYKEYHFKFVSIAKDADNLRKKIFNNPHNILFKPADDILDIASILKKIQTTSIKKQETLYEFIKAELGNDIDVVKVDSNLASIINIVANENLDDSIESPEINCFEINKKIEFNNLLSVKDAIDEYKVYYNKLNEKYTEFDKLGANKSLSVFRVIKGQYIRLLPTHKDSHDLFFAIIDSVINIIFESKNYIEIPYEELEMCVYILVIDTFIRCKIFKNPEGYNHVTTR